MNRRIKLYCTTNEDFPLKLVDVVDLFLRELSKRGIEQEWYCRNRQEGGFRRASIAGTPVYVPPWTTRFGAPGKIACKLLYWLLDAALLLRFVVKPVDIIQVRDKYFAAVVGLAVARLRGRVFTVWVSYPFPEHSLDIAAQERGGRALFEKVSGTLGVVMLYRIAMRYADHCFVQSEQMKHDLHEHWGIELSQMTPVPMGISERVRDFVPAGMPGPTHNDDPIQTVMYLGTLHRVRRLETMIDAFIAVGRARPKARFLIVGEGLDPSDRKRLESRVRAAGLMSRFEFTGFIPLAQAWQRIAGADVCVSPFLTNRVLRVASPTKLVEYMAFGKAIVANDHPEHSRVLAASGGGICVPWSIDGFAQGILRCLDDPEEARAMGAKGRQWVLENRTYARIADSVHAQYLRLLGAEP